MKSDATWFRQAGWGVFLHYLTRPETPADAWSRQVDGFDVPGLGAQLEAAGAPYLFVTIGQISGHYCSPNETFESLVGQSPSKCSRRDLIAELADELAGRGIRMMVYLASEGPSMDPPARRALGWTGHGWNDPDLGGRDVVETWTDKRQRVFQGNWQRVVREWSLRWGPRVGGWWIDGCYFKKHLYEFPEAPNFASFAAAIKAGNPEALVAFNGGVYAPVIGWSDAEDFTAGEIADALPAGPEVGDARPVGGAQYHILTYMGASWGKGPARFDGELAAAYTRFVRARGGVITWDVPVEPGGRIPREFHDRLCVIGRAR